MYIYIYIYSEGLGSVYAAGSTLLQPPAYRPAPYTYATQLTHAIALTKHPTGCIHLRCCSLAAYRLSAYTYASELTHAIALTKPTYVCGMSGWWLGGSVGWVGGCASHRR